MKTIVILMAVLLTGCAIGTPVGVVHPRADIGYRTMKPINEAWNCYVSNWFGCEKDVIDPVQ